MPARQANAEFVEEEETLLLSDDQVAEEARLAEQRHKEAAEQVRSLITRAASESYGTVSSGNSFEKICLWLKPLNGQRFRRCFIE